MMYSYYYVVKYHVFQLKLNKTTRLTAFIIYFNFFYFCICQTCELNLYCTDWYCIPLCIIWLSRWLPLQSLVDSHVAVSLYCTQNLMPDYCNLRSPSDNKGWATSKLYRHSHTSHNFQLLKLFSFCLKF